MTVITYDDPPNFGDAPPRDPRLESPAAKRQRELAEAAEREAEERARTLRGALEPKLDALRGHLAAAERAMAVAELRARAALRPLLEGAQLSDQERAVTIERAAQAHAESVAMQHVVSELGEAVDGLEAKLP
jgi:hypothetical protein